ncbi:MAG: S8 family peptidase [Minisyncoccia bacterium]
MKNHKKAGLVLLTVLIIYAMGMDLTIAGRETSENNKIAGQYIVVLNDNVADVDEAVNGLEKAHGLGHLQTYKHVMKGFAASIPDSELAHIKSDPRVKFVSEDRVVHAYDVSETRNGVSNAGRTGSAQPAQVIPTGVNRIDAESLGNKGAGVVVAVIDTGIDTSHRDLLGQVIGGINCSTGKPSNYKDGNGHGTHVAGTIAALNNSIGVVGVAPQAKLLAVRVLDNYGSGTWSSVICGIDWVTANASAKNIKVANMSLGGTGLSDNNCGNTNGDALHRAICRSRDAGVTYVVAAGNEGENANLHVPSAYDDAVITVSALADSDGLAGGIGGSLSGWNYPDDTFADFSNYGAVVDIGAPGVNIRSTWKGGTYNTISGTSMASPHVAGVAALYIANHISAGMIEVRDALIASGEASGSGHTDPSEKHPEPIVKAKSF